jgi:hypothetical protein
MVPRNLTYLQNVFINRNTQKQLWWFLCKARADWVIRLSSKQMPIFTSIVFTTLYTCAIICTCWLTWITSVLKRSGPFFYMKT